MLHNKCRVCAVWGELVIGPGNGVVRLYLALTALLLYRLNNLGREQNIFCLRVLQDIYSVQIDISCI